MIVLGVDCDKELGVAIYDTRRTASGIFSKSLKVGEEGKMDRIAVARNIRQSFVPVLKEFNPVLVAIEAPQIHGQSYTSQEGKETINTRSIAVTNWIGGTLAGLCFAWNIRCFEVWPNSWQSVIPTSIKRAHEGKDRVKAFCDLLRIQGANKSCRDASVIAYWTVHHSQEFKLIRHGAEA